jgi:lysophospholipase L1-like esterase
MNRSRLALLAALLAVSLAASAQTPLLQKVAPPASLKPLRISIGGRVLASPSAETGFGPDDYASQWPGTYFEASFKGTELYLCVGASHETLHVVVDGRTPIPLVYPEPGVYRLSGLADAPHSVTVFVVSESQSAPNHFGGFALPAQEKALPPPPRRSRQIEFIGDSHTVGYGNTSPKRDCTSAEVDAATDNSQAFGPLVADHYHADYQVNAISGRGIVRNYNGGPGDLVPTAYPYVLFDTKRPYSDPAWRPQVIVIALGTNDFSTPLNPGEKWKTRDALHADFEATYVRFIQTLRARNPDAYIVLWATGLSGGEIESEARRVVEQAKAQGENRLAFLPIDNLSFTACHYHPSLADDKTIEQKLVQQIDAVPGVWQGR